LRGIALAVLMVAVTTVIAWALIHYLDLRSRIGHLSRTRNIGRLASRFCGYARARRR
jgi:hypothetical protein